MNIGPAIDHVAITLTFPFAVNVLGNRCSSLPRLTKTAICLLGPVAQGGTANAAIPFTAPATAGPFPLKGIAAFIVTGSGHPTAGLLSASATGTVFASTDAAHKGTCTTAPNPSTTATASSHVVALDTVPQPSDPALQFLGCTPVGVAVDPPPLGLHTETLSVFVPQLVAAAKVTLTFPDEFLPGGFDADGHHTLPGLQEFSDAGAPLGFVVNCSSHTATTIPTGRDACILSIKGLRIIWRTV